MPEAVELFDRDLNRTYDRDGLPTSMVNLNATLEHLSKNQFIEARREASGWAIRLGSRLAGWDATTAAA